MENHLNRHRLNMTQIAINICINLKLLNSISKTWLPRNIKQKFSNQKHEVFIILLIPIYDFLLYIGLVF